MLMHLLRVLWVRWKAFGHRLATLQSRVLLFLFYYVVLAPFALAMRAGSDPLRLRRGAGPAWLERVAPNGEIALLARRQF